MKETAVEWLIRVLELESFENINLYSMKAIEQAKEMEKEQISQAYVFGSAYGIDLKNGLNPNNYFKETFNK